jgi:membrane protease YdiL (CAAX protease family)
MRNKYTKEQVDHLSLPTKRLATILFAGLLILRLLDQALIAWIFGEQVPPAVYSWFATLIYLGLGSVLLLRRYDLHELNVDHLFMFFYLAGAVLLIVFYLPADARIVVTIPCLLILWAWINGDMSPSPKWSAEGRMWWLPLLSLLGIVPVYIYYIISTGRVPFAPGGLAGAFFRADLSMVVFEEFLFRGYLWDLLKSRRLSDWNVIFIQAGPFWAAHLGLHRSLYDVLFALPIGGILLGYMVLRTRSIGQSTISHFIFNILAALL